MKLVNDLKFDVVNLEVTNFCNFNCSFCPQLIMKRKKGFMKVSLAKRLLREIKELELANNIFFHVMGEPLLHPQLMNIVKFSKKLNFKNHLFTNGWLLSEREEVVKYLDRIELSFQLLNRKEFEVTRPGINFDAYIEKIKKGLEICKKYPVKVDIAVMINPFQNLLGLKSGFKVIPPTRKLEEVKKFLIRSCKIKKELNWEIIFKILEPWGSSTFSTKIFYQPFFGSCLGLQSHFAILWDGTLTTCCKDYDGLNKLGDVNKKTLKEILFSYRVKKIRKLLKMNIIPPLPYCKICKSADNLKGYIMNQFGSIFFHRIFKPLVLEKNKKVSIY